MKIYGPGANYTPAADSFMRSLFGRDEYEDFVCFQGSSEWTFTYAPLGLVTGKIPTEELARKARCAMSKEEMLDWFDERVRAACDIDPLRVMRIAQVGP